ncbi:MAG: hypothetical protein FWE22_01130 [Firmicutes bacterium]|nr:hypothetical protein [Bacillota bacterium]
MDMSLSENKKFLEGKEFFDEKKFTQAIVCFREAKNEEPDNMIFSYYELLCDIYHNAKSFDYDAFNRFAAFLNEIFKINENLLNNEAFVKVVLYDAYFISKTQYQITIDKHDNALSRTAFRILGMRLIDTLYGFLNFLKKKNIADLVKNRTARCQRTEQSLIDILDLGVKACVKFSQPYLDAKGNLDVMREDIFGKTIKIYIDFVEFAKKCNEQYNELVHSADYITPLDFAQNVLQTVKTYNDLNRSNAVNHYSITGETLKFLNKECKAALSYAYNVCFRVLGGIESNAERAKLMEVCIPLALELLMPRFYISGAGRTEVMHRDYHNIRQIADIAALFLTSVSKEAKKNTKKTLEKFYRRSFESSFMHFKKVSEEYGDRLFGKKLLDRLEKAEKKKEARKEKEKQRKKPYVVGKEIEKGLSRKEIELNDYKYYKEFLYKLACFSFVASVELILYVFHNVKFRKKLVKLCKKVCEEFLFLENYYITKIEQDPKYRHVVKMFAMLDDESVIVNEESILQGDVGKLFMAKELGYVENPKKLSNKNNNVLMKDESMEIGTNENKIAIDDETSENLKIINGEEKMELNNPKFNLFNFSLTFEEDTPETNPLDLL